MNEQRAVNFYGIEADRVRPVYAAERGPDWTLADLPWRAFWLRSEYHHLAGSERRRAHSLAAFLGALTGAAFVGGLIYLLG